jgi:hypothetical protein
MPHEAYFISHALTAATIFVVMPCHMASGIHAKKSSLSRWAKLDKTQNLK